MIKHLFNEKQSNLSTMKLNLSELILTKGKVTTYEEIVSALPKTCKSIIDIGCGNGTFLKYLDKDIPYFGIDLSENEIRDANILCSSRSKTHFKRSDIAIESIQLQKDNVAIFHMVSHIIPSFNDILSQLITNSIGGSFVMILTPNYNPQTTTESNRSYNNAVSLLPSLKNSGLKDPTINNFHWKPNILNSLSKIINRSHTIEIKEMEWEIKGNISNVLGLFLNTFYQFSQMTPKELSQTVAKLIDFFHSISQEGVIHVTRPFQLIKIKIND